MAKSKLAYPYEELSGQLTRPTKNNPCRFRTQAKMLRQSGHVTRLYVDIPSERTTPPSAKEMALHTKFRTVALARDERAQDLMHMTQDQAAYSEAKKVTGFKYHSFRNWLFAKAWENYKEESHSVVWPESL